MERRQNAKRERRREGQKDGRDDEREKEGAQAEMMIKRKHEMEQK
jgi:hypothetical protein